MPTFNLRPTELLHLQTLKLSSLAIGSSILSLKLFVLPPLLTLAQPTEHRALSFRRPPCTYHHRVTFIYVIKIYHVFLDTLLTPDYSSAGPLDQLIRAFPFPTVGKCCRNTYTMEFAQYYRQDNSIEHLGYPIFPTSSEPSVVTQQQHYMPTPAPRSTMNNFNAPASNTTPKEAEEPDTSSRPRLTTEQTNILEEHFQRESKPVTDVKKQLAAQIGLPLDKVNVRKCLLPSRKRITRLTGELRIGTKIVEPRRSI